METFRAKQWLNVQFLRLKFTNSQLKLKQNEKLR